MDPIKPDEPLSFTEKQQRFIEEYPRDCNASAAARRAGYSPDSAADIGYELKQNPAIMAAINERLKVLAMGADEAVKRVSDIASTRLNDFLKIEKRTRPTKVAQPLADAIAAMEEQIEFEEEFALLADLSGKEATAHEKEQQLRRRLIIRWQLQLQRDPDAATEVPGPPEEYEAVAVDMVALANAKELGSIKTLTYGEFGPKVEMYAADAALRDILKLAGRYVERSEVTGKDGAPLVPSSDPSKLDTEDLRALLTIRRKMKSGEAAGQ